jgi:hypothetical protein
MKNFFENNPYKLTYDKSTDSIGFVPQTEEDKLETQKLIEQYNNFRKDTTSEAYLNAKAKSDNLKAEIERLHKAKNQ